MTISEGFITEKMFAQVEIVTTVTTDQPRRVSGTVVMKVLDSEANYTVEMLIMHMLVMHIHPNALVFGGSQVRRSQNEGYFA